jgi:hypothetical protein
VDAEWHSTTVPKRNFESVGEVNQRRRDTAAFHAKSSGTPLYLAHFYTPRLSLLASVQILILFISFLSSPFPTFRWPYPSPGFLRNPRNSLTTDISKPLNNPVSAALASPAFGSHPTTPSHHGSRKATLDLGASNSLPRAGPRLRMEGFRAEPTMVRETCS